MKWRPVSEHPPADEPLIALLAKRDPHGECDLILMGLYVWDGIHWRSEETMRRLNPGDCYWCPEREIVDTLRPLVRVVS